MRKLLLNCKFALGDVVMLSAAVRDLHQCYPGQFLTDVRSFNAEIWRHNPYLVPLDPQDPEVECIDCHYPLINQSNRAPYHCLHGFIAFLNDTLGLEIKPTCFHGDIHLSRQEKSWFSQVRELTTEDIPFWIVSAGGKYDITIKWWSTERFQAVVDHFRGRIQFVQIGAQGHWHPKLRGVVDLRGRTDVRQLIRLVYHAQGVLCPVTGLMHLAAAVETRPERPSKRPCVVVAGGREPAHWEAYPHHQFLHTMGALPCCSSGGCWRSRTLPLGEDERLDHPTRLCVDVVDELPRCLHMITAEDVVDRIETYFQTGTHAYLTPSQARDAETAVAATKTNEFDDLALHDGNARQAARFFLRSMPAYPGGYRGRGIVLGAGHERYLLNAWVCVHRLRQVGCRLPAELWVVKELVDLAEIFRQARDLRVRLRVLPEPDDRGAGRDRRPLEWELKPQAIIQSCFREVLWLDADNLPVVDPAFLFDEEPYQSTGAVFWTENAPFELSERSGRLLGLTPVTARRWETGQILVDKRRTWPALQLARWYGMHADYFCNHFDGDGVFQVAFDKLGLPCGLPERSGGMHEGAICHPDFEGRPLFFHRRDRKWDERRSQPPSPGFREETVCLEFVDAYSRKMQSSRTPPTSVHDNRLSEEPHFWHVFGARDPRAFPSEERETPARKTWERQYAQGQWRVFPVRPEQVPRLFRENGLRRFFLNDVIEAVLEVADPDDFIVLTKTDVHAAPSLTRRLLSALRGAGACYAYVRQGRDIRDFLSDEDIHRLTPQPSCGLFAFPVSWWARWASRMPDVILGESFWDATLRSLMQVGLRNPDACFDDLVYENANSEEADTAREDAESSRSRARLHNRTAIEALFGANGDSERRLALPRPRVVPSLPPVTICVLTYGPHADLARQCLESIRRHCPRRRYRLIVGANAVCRETRGYVDRLHARGEIDHLFVSEANLNKCPIMRHMFALVETEFIWWFDDDSYLTGPGVLEEFHRMAGESSRDVVLWGKHCYIRLPSNGGQCWGSPSDFVRRARWYGGRLTPDEQADQASDGNGDRPDRRWFFVTGGSWWMRSETVRRLDWPDARLVKQYSDVFLGEALRQQGLKSRQCVPPGLVINSAERRGDVGLMASREAVRR